MKKITVAEFIYQFPKKDNQLTKSTGSSPANPRRGLGWWAAGAVFGLFGALVFPLIAGVVVYLANDPTAHSSLLQKLSTISTVEVIPLLIFGGVCLAQTMKRTAPESGCSPRQLSNTTKGNRKAVVMLLTIAVLLYLSAQGKAQVSSETIANSQSSASSAATPSTSSKEASLIERIEKLERRLAELEAKMKPKASASSDTSADTSTAEIEINAPSNTAEPSWREPRKRPSSDSPSPSVTPR